MKWRTGRSTTAWYCWMIQKTHQLSSHDVGSRHLLQAWPLQVKTCPEKPAGRSWASWRAATTDQYYCQSVCSTGPATQRPFPDGITRRLTGRCSLALLMNTARQSRLTTPASTKPLTALTSPSWEQPLRQFHAVPKELQALLDLRATGAWGWSGQNQREGRKQPNAPEQHSQ